MKSELNAVVVRHVQFEDLGVLSPVLVERGYDIRYVDVTVDPLTLDDYVEPDLLVVLGGPVGVYDHANYPVLLTEVEGLQRRLERELPTVGICLGAQLMAVALGAEVRATGRTEIGISPLTLTNAGAASPLSELHGQPVLHWHGDEFSIPPGSETLASTPGFPNQAFMVGRHALALQFHIEADLARIEQWLMGHAHELASARIDIPQLRSTAAVHHRDLSEAAQRVFRRWLDETT